VPVAARAAEIEQGASRPAAVLVADVRPRTGRVHEAGEITPAAPVIAGPEHALLAWLLGRSGGGELAREGNGTLPDVPPLCAA
jgi:hypothetical protein